ncbi:DUF2793 domain-containing protein [Pseudorhodoplanes sp.]|uniref:DUF2793 domain-containing protein n=1 Tax=Pseudorhodoplanes sp. TaxID=1934341 RepID=UPI00391C41F8
MPTPRFGLPYIAQGQAQKEVTHNDALVRLDALVDLYILDRDLAAPPGSPADGDAYLVAASPTGAWAGQAGNIAYVIDGGWRFFVPVKGLVAYVADEPTIIVFTTSGWVDLVSVLTFQNLTKLGILTSADNTNRLAVKSNAILLSHDDVTPGTGDLRVTLNKSAAAKDAGFVFQDGFSTRALFGLLGDDNFVIKVSPDGSAFFNAARVFGLCGRADMRNSARRRYAEWFPNVNTTTLNAIGLTTTTTGTATAAALAATSMFTQSPRLIFASAASAGSSAGVNGTELIAWRGSSSDRGGFYLLMRFGWEITQPQGRCFAGLRGSTAVIGDVNPTVLTDIIGIGFNSGQSTMRVLHNDASGTASAINLGASFPSNSAQEFYELMLSAEPGGSEVQYRVERLNTGHVATGTISTNLPDAGTFLTPHLWGNNGTTAAAVQIALHTMYLENASLYGSRGF